MILKTSLICLAGAVIMRVTFDFVRKLLGL
jgi:hypothetical protein